MQLPTKMSNEKAVLCHVLVLLCLVSCVLSQSKVIQSDDGQSGTIKFSTPDLNDEEANSPWMPSQLKCDACRIIAFQLHEQFTKFNDIHKSLKYNVPESEVLDITETVCDRKTYETYGVKEVHKVQRLTGPGAEHSDVPGVTAGGGKWPESYGLTQYNGENRLKGRGLETEETPGIMQGGGKWPGRLEDMCNTYMGELGEMTIYKAYKKNPKSRKQFEDYLCRKSGLRGECTRFEAEKKKEEAMKRKAKEEEEERDEL